MSPRNGLLLAALIASGPMVVLAMNIRENRWPIARAPDGVTLYEVEAAGPEGGGSLAYRIQGKAPGDTVEFVASSNFSPGDGSRPQTIAPELCRQRLAALGAELAKRKIPGVTVHPEACESATRAGVVAVKPEVSAEAARHLGTYWREGLPSDVIDFVTRRGGCNHWAGEEPYSKARRKEIEDGFRRNRCNRIDADEKKLRKKYAGRPDVLRVLDAARTFFG